MTRTFPSPVETAADFPKHCRVCGRRLSFDEVTVGFYADDGAPIVRARAYCRGSWVERLIVGLEDMKHDDFIVNPRPPMFINRVNA